MKKEFDELLAKIQFDEKNQDNVREKIKEMEQKEMRYKERKWKLVVAVCVCVVALSGVCFAVDLPQKVIEKFGAWLEPVDETCVFDDIELKTIAAACDNDSLIVYFTTKDLRENRIQEGTNVYDYRMSEATILGCHPVDYNAKTKELTWCLEGDAGAKMKGKKMTISVNSFVNGSLEMTEQETGVNVYDLLNAQQTNNQKPVLGVQEDAYENWNAQNQAGVDLQEKTNKENNILLLPEGDKNLKVNGTNWLTIDNLSYEDGWLHILAKIDKKLQDANHGYFYLADENGNELPNAVLNKPYVESNLEEYIIQVEQFEDLQNVKLMMSATNSSELISGNWQVQFTVKGVETKTAACHLQNQNGVINEVEASPLGITLRGKGVEKKGDNILNHMNPMENCTVSYQLKDKTVVPCDGSETSSIREEQVICKWKATTEIDMEQVEAVIVDQIVDQQVIKVK